MVKSAGNMLNVFIDFCRERSDILMTTGAALIILIIIFAIIKSVAKKDNDEEDFEFDERDFQADKLYEQLNDEEQVSDKSSEKSDEIQHKVISKKKINATVGNDRIESLLGEIANIPIKNLEEVEIKIQGAELKFKYSNPSSEDRTGECGLLPNDGKDEEAKEAEAVKEVVEKNSESKNENDDKCIDEKCVQKNDKDNVIIRKFGPDNVNVSRSGHVFTEDELEKQIRD